MTINVITFSRLPSAISSKETLMKKRLDRRNTNPIIFQRKRRQVIFHEERSLSASVGYRAHLVHGKPVNSC
jgi:hypothetical protein